MHSCHIFQTDFYSYFCRKIHVSSATKKYLENEYDFIPAFGAKRDETLAKEKIETFFVGLPLPSCRQSSFTVRKNWINFNILCVLNKDLFMILTIFKEK